MREMGNSLRDCRKMHKRSPLERFLKFFPTKNSIFLKNIDQTLVYFPESLYKALNFWLLAINYWTVFFFALSTSPQTSLCSSSCMAGNVFFPHWLRSVDQCKLRRGKVDRFSFVFFFTLSFSSTLPTGKRGRASSKPEEGSRLDYQLAKQPSNARRRTPSTWQRTRSWIF